MKVFNEQEKIDSIEPLTIKTPNDLTDRTKTSYPLSRKWVFRGQTQDWPLATTLERLCVSLGIEPEHYRQVEKILLREFKRRFYHYETHVPQPSDNLEWFAIMQHYGAATRLLDWTYSPYVALYNALEREASNGKHAVVWALDLRWLQGAGMKVVERYSKYKNMNKEDKEMVRHFMLKAPTAKEKQKVSNWLYKQSIRFIFPSTPFNLNQRLAVQKGLFMSLGSLTNTFIANLISMPGFNNGYKYKNDNEKNIWRFHIVAKGKERRKWLRELLGMNVSADSLFPGLDGFARSLNVYHHRFDELK
ncbi:MAG: FRG domain-containing protein [Planctomycetes bacterium]|nr:FRG domain-containing protein [Planctomycetota bacterium]